MTRAEIKQLIDEGAQKLNQAAVALGCARERDMIHDAAARLFLISCGEKNVQGEDSYERTSS
uniref:Uncharacterized protein n=1 Tax=viral metagenome TaxID=1070528 RepID=A0A6M3LIL8_9ZZZZ